MSKNLLVIVIPFQFSNSDYERLEVSYLKKFIEVKILDISLLIHPNLDSANQFTDSTSLEIIQVSSLKNLFHNLKLFSKTHSKIVFMNMIQLTNLNSLIFNLSLKFFNFNFITFSNPGVPINRFENNLNIFNKILHTIRYKGFHALLTIIYFSFIKKINSIIKNKPQYLLVAGEKYYKNLRVTANNKTRILKGSSWDCSRYFRFKEESNSLQFDKKFIVLLEGITPIGKGDAMVNNHFSTFTPEKWFPSVCSFLQRLEEKYKCQTIVAAHPKSKHSKNPKYLGYRKVLSNDTFDLIKNANLVIGRNSASFSMAVLMNKPIATIYNSELKENAIDLQAITNFANEMGVYSINIDSEYPFTEADKLFKINQNKYKEFTKNFLTSRDDEMPNYKVILSEVFEIIL